MMLCVHTCQVGRGGDGEYTDSGSSVERGQLLAAVQAADGETISVRSVPFFISIFRLYVATRLEIHVNVSPPSQRSRDGV